MNQMLKKASSVCAAAVCAASLMFSGASVVMAGSEIDEEIMTQITMTAEGLTQTIIPLSDEEIEAYLESGDEFTEGAMTAWDDARDEVGELKEAGKGRGGVFQIISILPQFRWILKSWMQNLYMYLRTWKVC